MIYLPLITGFEEDYLFFTQKDNFFCRHEDLIQYQIGVLFDVVGSLAGIKEHRAKANKGDLQEQYNIICIVLNCLNRSVIDIPFEALFWILETCESGEERALEFCRHFIGIEYEPGMNRDAKRVFRFLTEAAAKNNNAACLTLYFCYYYGNGVERDVNKAFEYLDRSVHGDNAIAEYILALEYYYARHYQEDYENASLLAGFAQEKGFPAATAFLSFLYRSGFGVAKDEKKALELLQEGAKQVDCIALRALAHCYLDGELGLEQDEKKAIELMIKASDSGNREASVFLADAYETGNYGLPIDHQKSTFYLFIAAHRGHVEAMYEISRNFYMGKDQNFNLSHAFLMLAARNGLAHAQLTLGYVLMADVDENDEDLIYLAEYRDPEQILYWLQAAHDQKHPLAASALADFYLVDRGPDYPADPQKAITILTQDGKENLSSAEKIVEIYRGDYPSVEADPEALMHWQKVVRRLKKAEAKKQREALEEFLDAGGDLL